MPPRVTVVIPNWNGERFLDLCLGSLRNQSFGDFETILVDNGSKDGSLGFTAENYPEVKTISLGVNRGFAAAVNAGIKASETEYVALLNNDTEQDPGWLEALVQAAEDRPESGLFASKLRRLPRPRSARRGRGRHAPERAPLPPRPRRA